MFLQWLLAIWVMLSALLPVNLYPVRNSGIYLCVALELMVVLPVGVWVARNPDRVPWRSRLATPMLALMAAVMVAGAQGAVFYDTAVEGAHRFVAVQIYAVALYSLSIAAAFTIAALVRTPQDVQRLRALVILSTLGLLARGFGTVIVNVPARNAYWWPLVTGHGAALATAWALYEKPRHLWQYGAVVLYVGAVMANVVLVPFLRTEDSQWISGWIAVAMPLGLLLLLRYPRQILAFAVPLVLILALWQWDRIDHVYRAARDEGDFQRLHLWRDAVWMSYQRPLFGVGPGNYLDYIMRYGGLDIRLSSPHGNYQQIAAETGLVGLGFALWLFMRVIALGLRIYGRTADITVRSTSIAITCALLGQLSAALLGDFVLPNYHNGGYHTIGVTIYSWMMIGLLMSLERIEGLGATVPVGASAESRSAPPDLLRSTGTAATSPVTGPS